MGNYPWRWMHNKLSNSMKMRKGNGNTTTLLFSLKGLEILHQEGRGQVNTIVMEDYNGILFHKSRLANKQHTIHSVLSFPYGLSFLCLFSYFYNLWVWEHSFIINTNWILGCKVFYHSNKPWQGCEGVAGLTRIHTICAWGFWKQGSSVSNTSTTNIPLYVINKFPYCRYFY
jgi:hypothetical protein